MSPYEFINLKKYFVFLRNCNSISKLREGFDFKNESDVNRWLEIQKERARQNIGQ